MLEISKVTPEVKKNARSKRKVTTLIQTLTLIMLVLLVLRLIVVMSLYTVKKSKRKYNSI